MEIFDKILALYVEINDIYHMMLQLELDNKINKEEFLNLLELLKKKLYLEKEMFSQFLDDYSEDYKWILSLLENDILELDDYVVSRLHDYMSIHVNDIKLEDVTFEEKLEKLSVDRLDMLYRECSKNLCLVYLSFLGDYINSQAFNSIKMPLLGFKYFNSLINHDMESVLLYNNFSIGRINYIDFNFMSTGLMIDTTLSEEIRHMVYGDAIRNSVIEILSFNDVDYNDEYKKCGCINSGCMLRAALLLLNDDKECYDIAIADVYKLLNEMENSDNQLSVSLVKSIIECKEIDNVRIKKISIRTLG